jgi:uncharacterized membrane protein YjdF
MMINDLVKRFDYLIVTFFLLAGSLFLFRLAYLPIYTSTSVGLVLLWMFREFIKIRFQIVPPIWVLFLLLGAIEVDALGNLFGLYNRTFSVIQYDEISHCLISGLVMPVVTWLLMLVINRNGFKLSVGYIAFFAFTTVFTFAGFYEVIELWDDKYMHQTPGWRIHSPYDSPNDLQWDLLGMGTGAIAAYFLLKKNQ